jgi:hypothetical protein
VHGHVTFKFPFLAQLLMRPQPTKIFRPNPPQKKENVGGMNKHLTKDFSDYRAVAIPAASSFARLLFS